MFTIRTAPLAAVTLLALAGTVAPPANAASTTFDYSVDPKDAPDVYRDIPGTEITFDAKAGDRSYLWSRNLTASSLTPLALHENIGHTFAVRCANADGTAFPESTEAGAYWAANLTPPAEKSLNPGIRWMFTAPHDGAFTCRLSVVAYSTVVDGGKPVTMRIAAGAELGRLPVPSDSGARWTLPKESGRTVTAGTTASTLGYTLTPRPDRDLTIVQDANLSTCTAKSALCGGGTAAHKGTRAETWIEARPQNADGTDCGALVKGPVAKWNITDDRHHQTATNTLTLTPEQAAGCARIRTTLKVANTEGNPVLIHAGLASNGIAATHGTAFSR
ncbi:hypothetical protein ACN20G_27320 (plasmid) [Streptomyces sp. BI20]|uniref:hypothetical protein n=1 Tax=Streptomyces sp. BI20 TaxID=3403460 RepID=UPI003C76EDA3